MRAWSLAGKEGVIVGETGGLRDEWHHLRLSRGYISVEHQ